MRSLLTAMPPIPLLSPVLFHANGGPSFGHCCSKPVSFETASRSGPCHCGQSSAEAVESQPQAAVIHTPVKNVRNRQRRVISRLRSETWERIADTRVHLTFI